MNKKNQLLSGLKKATIELLLLKLLSEEDMYGYELAQELKKRSKGRYTILEGSMYPILYRLTEKKYITFYEKRVGARKIRVYYHLESTGKAYFQELLRDYRSHFDIIEFLLNSERGDVCGEQ